MRLVALISSALLMMSAPVHADNPAGALSDEELVLIQQAALGCGAALTALRREDPSLAASCADPALDAKIARPLAEVGRMNGMVRACNNTVWADHAREVLRWSRDHGAPDDALMHRAVYNAGHLFGMVAVNDGRSATACVDGQDFSMHYFANNVAPLL